ncbi:hypothetical protein [Streptomyces fructofermentans]|uniref:Uncharacterized protein n=1 Tax=Streptomyces fructofermentans TaxID=152141 RepID=A0A918NMW3_9ACTN|nr:hypothetical protein [Streptomyces fructofermentans]GGX82049.1 hypothetical protein GCM10010515_57130 [Streptomyces fructofermentans]
MAAHFQGPNGLVSVHVAVRDPATMAEPDPEAADYARDLFAASAKYAAVSWSALGAEPRWLGMDTSTCAAAINPSRLYNRGADEFDRFLSGAASRGEPALIIATMGNEDDGGLRRNIFSRYDASVDFLNFTGSIAGKRLLAGAEVSLAPGLDAADRDLGLRLQNRPAGAPWWAMALQSIGFEGPRGTTVHEPEGELVPILVDSVGEPVAARWMPSDGWQIWYVIPDAVDWNTMVDWIVQKALPEHVPAALRRVRSLHSIDADLETPAETKARAALDELERRYLDDKARLQTDLEQARQEAEPMRSGLLYGTGRELEVAVAVVLRAAGFTVTELDAELGTQSADLLAVLDQETCLIEVKAASGAAPEKLVSYLQRHLDKWPQLRPDQPVTCSALIVNHQHRLDPAQRPTEVYQRNQHKEFVDALTFPVLASGQLFGWWRTQDWPAVRTAVLGRPQSSQPSTPSTVQSTANAPRQRRPWFRSRGANSA